VPSLIHSSELASLTLREEMEPFGGIYTAKLAPCVCNSYLLLRVNIVTKLLVGVLVQRGPAIPVCSRKSICQQPRFDPPFLQVLRMGDSLPIERDEVPIRRAGWTGLPATQPFPKGGEPGDLGKGYLGA